MSIGVVTGAFDILHAGHVHLFKEAKKKCDYLVVALHLDPSIKRSDKNKPIESILNRQIKLNACRYVDRVVVYEHEEDLLIIFKYYDISIRFLGSDYKDPDKDISFPELVPIEYIDSIDIHSSDYDHN